MPWLTGEAARIVEAAIRTKVRQLEGITHAVGVMPDHVHVAASLPPAIGLSDAIGQVKGLSSYLVRARCPELAGEGFQWQGSFGVTSVSEASLPRLLGYVDNQKTHHRDLTLYAALERTERHDRPSLSADRGQPPDGMG